MCVCVCVLYTHKCAVKGKCRNVVIEKQGTRASARHDQGAAVAAAAARVAVRGNLDGPGARETPPWEEVAVGICCTRVSGVSGCVGGARVPRLGARIGRAARLSRRGMEAKCLCVYAHVFVCVVLCRVVLCGMKRGLWCDEVFADGELVGPDRAVAERHSGE